MMRTRVYQHITTLKARLSQLNWTRLRIPVGILATLLLVLNLSQPLIQHCLTHTNYSVSQEGFGGEFHATLIIHNVVEMALRDVWLGHSDEPPWTRLGYLVDTASEISLRFRVWNLLDVIVFSWPLRTLLGTLSGWNAIFLTLALLNALSGWWMGLRLTGSATAGVVGGLLLAFNPLAFVYTVEARPMQLVLFPFPIILVCTLAILEKDNAWKEVILGGVSLAALALFYWFYGLFAGMAIAVLLLVPPRRIPLKRLGRLFLMGVISLMISAPFFADMAQSLTSGEGASALPRSQLVTPHFPPPGSRELTQDQRNVLVDSLPIDAPLALKLPRGAMRETNLGYVGIPLLLLTLVALTRPRQAMPWVVMIGVGWLFALGPWPIYAEMMAQPRGDGETLRNGAYHFLYNHLSVFRQFLHPYRFVVLEYLGLAVLSTQAVGILFRGELPFTGGRDRFVAGGLGLLALFTLEGNWVSLGHLPTQVFYLPSPPDLDEMVAPEGVLLHLPLLNIGATPIRSDAYEERRRLFQAFHGRPTIFLNAYPNLTWLPDKPPPEGLTAPPPPAASDWRVRAFYTWQHSFDQMPGLFVAGPGDVGTLSDELKTALQGDGIRWILLDEAGVAQVHGVEAAAGIYDQLRQDLIHWLGKPHKDFDLDNSHFLRWKTDGGTLPEHLRVAIFEVPKVR